MNRRGSGIGDRGSTRGVAALVLCLTVLGACASTNGTNVAGGANVANVANVASGALGPVRLASATALDSAARRAIESATRTLAATADALDPANGFPRMTDASGRWVVQPVTQWTSGFFPGSLWYLYALTGDAAWRARAERWQAPLAPTAARTNTHDLGFLLFDSFGLDARLTGDTLARTVVLRASRSLAARFNPIVGAIKSWDVDTVDDRRRDWPGRFPVIIDNMMNLEMLWWAARQPGGDPRWATIATRHAETSLRAHVRDDATTAHVALFDPRTGALLGRVTWQGHADSSVWSRGQAWAAYGFTAAYRETRRPEFLAGARRTADWFLAHLPADQVPYWDFLHPDIPRAERDASAAAVMTSALFELARLAEGDERARYRTAAEHILASLCANYLGPSASNAALLLHATGNRPANGEIDTGIVYADYYFLEALYRYEQSRVVR